MAINSKNTAARGRQSQASNLNGGGSQASLAGGSNLIAGMTFPTNRNSQRKLVGNLQKIGALVNETLPMMGIGNGQGAQANIQPQLVSSQANLSTGLARKSGRPPGSRNRTSMNNNQGGGANL